ncbi:MAG: putative DNA binding domain-containing protein [Deltaproteobacteria bacterium]|nr:putative DNA binding domain-containing protein [Deltaproteobacteria bacterium]
MTVSVEQLQTWMHAKEDEHLEFKEAKKNFHFETLVKYCVALANEGGGRMILGVTDKRPRRVVGSQAFSDLERTKAGLIERLRLRVEVEEIQHPQGRVLVFQVPSRPIGMPIQYEGAYWMRGGEDLIPMTPDVLQRIFAEASPDFSAELCPAARLEDLDPVAVEVLRRFWQRKSPDQDITTRAVEQLLADAELVVDGRVTYAALILLGKRQALGKHLAQAEVIFEYRSNEAPGPAADRHEFRQGFLPVLDEIWRLINLRNDLQHFQQRFFVWDVPTFNERVVREAVLNAVSHRDYRHGGSVFVRQYPRRVEIVSPGGLPPGIVPENILRQQNPRNRRIAEVLSKCGLVERAGQGFDFIYRECIRQSKPLPDFSHTDAHFVWLTLHGEIQDLEFLRFLEEIGQERMATFSTNDFLVVDLVHREQPVPAHLKSQVAHLLDQGIIERMGRGRGVRLLLSQRFYRRLGKAGVYTRKRGLDRETNKALLVRHLQESGEAGCPLSELQQVLPAQSRDQLKRLLSELRQEGRARLVGERRGARWRTGERA